MNLDNYLKSDLKYYYVCVGFLFSQISTKVMDLTQKQTKTSSDLLMRVTGRDLQKYKNVKNPTVPTVVFIWGNSYIPY